MGQLLGNSVQPAAGVFDLIGDDVFAIELQLVTGVSTY
jgi:hypothetical protein